MKADVRATPLSVDEALALVRHPGAGGIAFFVGAVRDASAGRVVTRLEYSAYATMAVREMEKIATEIEAELPGVRCAALHRTGMLEVGEIAVVCAASAPHRGEAFQACRLLIDRIKERVPVWKRELGPDGAAWVGWEDARCMPDGTHAHHAHEPAPHAHHAHEPAPHAHHAHEPAPHDHHAHEPAPHDHAHAPHDHGPPAGAGAPPPAAPRR